MKISPSSSLSRLRSILLFNTSAERASAPDSPVSSSTVNKHSIGPCSISFASNIAKAVATPMPSSAPKVVPSAFNHSPSIFGTMASFSKSKTLSLFFSQTISICDCKQTQGEFSFPFVAPLRIITLPISSETYSKFLSFAQLIRYSVIFSSCFEGRGIERISSKNLNKLFGSKFAKILLFAIVLFLLYIH